MSIECYSRRRFNSRIASVSLWPFAAKAFAASTHELLITKSGAIADDSTVNTKAIQAAIDQLAAKGGGTVVVPKGVFVSGALFFKPKVNLRLTEGAVLKCSTDLSNFPAQRTRIEGELKARLHTGLRVLQLEDKLVEAREEMRFKATHDALTSLWNRAGILNLLHSEFSRATRHLTPLSLLVCDIDLFKKINDTYGHPVGDEILRQVSSYLCMR
jgi:predicted signal transduction protein with EAL and GGDEF domain